MMLRLNEIHTYYGSIRAIRGVSLYVEAGEMVCLIGANGAGKINDADDDIGHPSSRARYSHL